MKTLVKTMFAFQLMSESSMSKRKEKRRKEKKKDKKCMRDY